MSNNISFKAEFISPSIIKKASTGKEIRTSFVEHKSKCSKDRIALNGVESQWGEGNTFATGILSDFEKSTYDYTPNKKYFALTLQNKQWNELIPKKILGLAEIIQGEGRIKLKYLQADPKHNMHSAKRKFTGIGTAILNTLKSLFPQHDIVLQTAESARDFYIANGFEEIGKENEMIFRHSKEADLPK